MTKNTVTEKHSVEVDIEVEASMEAAWEVLSDFNDVYLWAPSVSESHSISDIEGAVGAARRCNVSGFGLIDEVVTSWTEGKGFTYQVGQLGPFAGSMSHWSLASVGINRTKLTVRLGYDVRFGWLGEIVHSLVLRSKLEGSLDGVAKAFKKRVETGELVRPRRDTANAVAA